MPGFMPGIHVFSEREKKSWMAGTGPAMTQKWNSNDFPLALDCFHRHGCVLPDLAQCHAARAHWQPWHRRRHQRALHFWLSLRAVVADRRDARDRRAAAAAAFE